MSNTSMVQGGSSPDHQRNLPGRLGQYLLARRTADPGWRGGWQFGDRAGPDDGDPGRATTALEHIFRRGKRWTPRTLSRLGMDFLVKEATQTVEAPPSEGRGSRTTIYIFEDSRELGGSLPADGLLIDTFPFVVGRLPERWESTPEIDVNLRFEDSRPYRMSRAHFAILRTDAGLQVRDLESTLGTSVDGVLLGRHFGRDTISLERGENFITAGGLGSQFRLKLVW